MHAMGQGVGISARVVSLDMHSLYLFSETCLRQPPVGQLQLALYREVAALWR